jgi:hypothetical protein
MKLLGATGIDRLGMDNHRALHHPGDGLEKSAPAPG